MKKIVKISFLISVHNNSIFLSFNVIIFWCCSKFSAIRGVCGATKTLHLILVGAWSKCRSVGHFSSVHPQFFDSSVDPFAVVGCILFVNLA